jgi:hypothetical protein
MVISKGAKHKAKLYKTHLTRNELKNFIQKRIELKIKE